MKKLLVLLLIPFTLLAQDKPVFTYRVIHIVGKHCESRKTVKHMLTLFENKFESEIPVDVQLVSFTTRRVRSAWVYKPDYSIPNTNVIEQDRIFNLAERYAKRYPTTADFTLFTTPSILATTSGATTGVCNLNNSKRPAVGYVTTKKWENYNIDPMLPTAITVCHEVGHNFGASDSHDWTNFKSINSPNAGVIDSFFKGEFIPNFSDITKQEINVCLNSLK